jgi:hypothetical protein
MPGTIPPQLMSPHLSPNHGSQIPQAILVDSIQAYDCMNDSAEHSNRRKLGTTKFKSMAGVGVSKMTSNVSLHFDFLDRSLEPEPEVAGARNKPRMFDGISSQPDLRLAPQNSRTTANSGPVSITAECGMPNRPIQHTRSTSRRNQQQQRLAEEGAMLNPNSYQSERMLMRQRQPAAENATIEQPASIHDSDNVNSSMVSLGSAGRMGQRLRTRNLYDTQRRAEMRPGMPPRLPQ